MTDEERDELLLRMDERLGRLENDHGEKLTRLSSDIAALRNETATLRREANEAHTAIGERIHSSFMALARKIDDLGK